MPEHLQETAPTAETQTAIPRWTPDFDVQGFDLQAVLREARAQQKSAAVLLKSLGYPVAQLTLTGDGLTETAAKGANIPVTASSTAGDLEGDEFDAEAIGQMRAAAKGTTVFLNHEYNVPEDVYGKVAEATVVKRSMLNPLKGRNEELTCLDLDITPVGEDENPRAVQVTNMLRKSQLKLGVSVTCLVLKYREREDGSRVITRVYYIESSIVGIPCNQTAWAHAGTSSKSFTPARAGEESSTTMPQPEIKADQPGPSFAQALVTMKAMFADVLHENQNNFWLYVDSLRTVYSRLLREARGKSGDAVTALVDEGNASVDEFAAELKKLLAEEIAESAAKESTTGSYYDYWSAVGRLQGLEGFVQKAGARNSAADLKLLNKAHDCIVEAGAECMHDSTAAATGGDVKSASFTGAGDLQAKVASLTSEKEDLAAQLEEALLAAETATKALEAERLTSKTAVDALEQFAQEPLPRAGAM